MKFIPPSQPLVGRYRDLLLERIEAAVDASKSERTKLRLLLAAADILEAGGYHELRIADILEKAGGARGTFYIYFKNKSDIVLDVLTDFRQSLFFTSTSVLADSDWQTKIYLSNLYFAQLHEYNSGLLRSFHQLVDEAAEFRRMRHETERLWVDRILHAHVRDANLPNDPASAREIRRRLHAVRAMVEHLCAQIYIEQMPDLIDLFPTAHDIAQHTTKVWIEALDIERNPYSG